jgi:WD40 repeat protein
MRILQGHQRGIRAVAFAPGDPATLASTGDDGLVRLWNPGAGECLARMSGHRDHVLTLAFSADGGVLVSGGRDGALIAWDVAMQQSLQRIEFHQGPVQSLAFAPNRNIVLAVLRSQQRPGDPNQLVFWEPTNRNLPPQPLDWPGSVVRIAFAPIGQTLALATQERTVEVVELGARRQQTPLPLRASITALAFAPASAPAALAIATGACVELRDLKTYQRLGICRGHRSVINTLAFAPDGQTLLTGSVDRTVRLWDVDTAAQRAAWKWDLGAIHSVAYAPDGMTAAAGGEKSDLLVWDLDGV